MASAATDEVYNRIPPGRRWLAGMVIAFANLMVILDLTIANVSIPHIAGDLGISMEQGAWVITSYAVAEAICVPLTGWLADRFGVVRIFVWAMGGFGLFSLLCGLSPTLQMLVICRIGQGLCGGPIMPMAQALMMRIFPPESRPKAMGLWAMTTLVGPAIGPILGGTISDNWSWHWIFLINVPIAIGCVFAALALLKPVESATRAVPIDKVGLLLMVFWIGCLQLVLDLGRDRDWFDDSMIVILALASAIGFAVFVIWELTEEHPAVDLRVFRHSGFSIAVIILSLAFGSYFASVVIVPQYLQATLGYPAAKAGLITAATAITAVMMAPVAGRLIGKVDLRVLISAALVWMAGMALMRAQWNSGIDAFNLALPLLLQGFAMPLMFIPLTTTSMSAVNPDEVASAAGLQTFVRTMSVAVSTSIVLTVWGDAQRTAQSEIVGRLQPEGALGPLSRLGLPPEVAIRTLAGIVEREAVALAVNHTFLITAVVMLVAAGIVWLLPRPRIVPGAAAAAH